MAKKTKQASACAVINLSSFGIDQKFAHIAAPQNPNCGMSGSSGDLNLSMRHTDDGLGSRNFAYDASDENLLCGRLNVPDVGRWQRGGFSVFQRFKVTGSTASLLNSTSCLSSPAAVEGRRNDDSFQRSLTDRSKPVWLRHSRREIRQALRGAVGARCRLLRIAQNVACADPCRRECRRAPALVRG
jgi:hypothetical protein